MAFCGVWGLADRSSSKCKDTTYGQAVGVFGVMFMICGIFILVAHLALLCYYKQNNALPEWLVGQKVPRPRDRNNDTAAAIAGQAAQRLGRKYEINAEGEKDK